MDVRPYRLWPARVPAQLQARLQLALERWRHDWGVGPATVSVRQAGAAPDNGAGWSAPLALGPGWVWLRGADALAAGLAGQVYPGALEAATLAAQAGHACLAALHQALRVELQLTPGEQGPATPPAHLGRAGSGALLASLTLGSSEMALLFDQAAILHLYPFPAAAVPAPLAPIDPVQLVNGHAVSLHVRIGALELSLAEVATLAAGDVLTLEQPLARPVPLIAPGGEQVCAARLLKEGGRLALAVCV